MKISFGDIGKTIGTLITRAENGELVQVARFGDTAAVLVSRERYEELTGEPVPDEPLTPTARQF